jgi:hypothetical protein
MNAYRRRDRPPASGTPAMALQNRLPDDVSRGSASLFFGRDRGMVFFLAFLGLTTIVVPTVTLSLFGRAALAFVFALTLVLGALTTIHHRIVVYCVVALAMSSLLVDLVANLRPSHGREVLDTALKLATLSILLFMTLKRTLRPGRVTVFRVAGGIAGYVLIGLTWTFAYQLLIQQAPGAIRFDAAVAAAPSQQPNDLIYFSFVTLTTVGYGDVRPVHPVARSLAVAEALVGQLYLAILIASLVGMALQARVEKTDSDPGDLGELPEA